MTRGKKLLFLLIALVIISGGTVAALTLLPQDDAETEETEETQEVVFTLDQDEITELTWEYGDNAFDFRKSGDDWIYVNDEAFPVRNANIRSMASAVASIESSKTIEDSDESEDFGLGDSATVVTITADKEYELRFGNKTDLSGERYCSIGDGKIYLVSTDLTSLFEVELLDLVQVETLPEITMSNTASFNICMQESEYTFKNLRAQGIDPEEDTDWYYNDGGEDLPLDGDSAETLVEYITELEFDTCVCYNETEDELSEYGLLEPEMVATVDYYTIDFESDEDSEDSDETDESLSVVKTPEQFVLNISGEYARIAGSQMIYQIDSTISETLSSVVYDSIQYTAEEEE